MFSLPIGCPVEEAADMVRSLVIAGALLTLSSPAFAQDDTKERAKALAATRDKGLDWLTKNQSADGSWGKTYTFAVTSFACLSYLSASDEPFTSDGGKALLKGLNFLLTQQKDGQ